MCNYVKTAHITGLQYWKGILDHNVEGACKCKHLGVCVCVCVCFGMCVFVCVSVFVYILVCGDA